MRKRFKTWWDFHRFSTAVKHSSRYVHNEEVLTFLDTLIETSGGRHRRITKRNYVVWRAQVGGATDEFEDNGRTWEELVPYEPDRMKPLRHAAFEGRVNPKGIPCLYVAND